MQPCVYNECECLLESMPWCECPLGSMPWCECPLVCMQWTQMHPYGYIMTQMLWCKHKLFKNSLYFQNEASSAPEIKIFSKLDLLFLKSHLIFDLRLPKNWWSLLENLQMKHWLGIWWSGSKDLFLQFGWAKGWLVFMAFFFEKMNSLKIKHLKKIHHFF